MMLHDSTINYLRKHNKLINNMYTIKLTLDNWREKLICDIYDKLIWCRVTWIENVDINKLEILSLQVLHNTFLQNWHFDEPLEEQTQKRHAFNRTTHICIVTNKRRCAHDFTTCTSKISVFKQLRNEHKGLFITLVDIQKAICTRIIHLFDFFVWKID